MTPSDIGWRIDPEGVERWWTGHGWREERYPGGRVAPQPAARRVSFQEQYGHLEPQRASADTAARSASWSSAAAAPRSNAPGPKRLWVAYLLAILLSSYGIHRLYLGRVVTGILMLTLQLTASTLLVIGLSTFLRSRGVDGFDLIMLGTAGTGVAGIWWIVDLFLIPGMVRSANAWRRAGGAGRY